jgi:hypothetical protein
MRTVLPIQSFSTKPASSLPVDTTMLGAKSASLEAALRIQLPETVNGRGVLQMSSRILLRDAGNYPLSSHLHEGDIPAERPRKNLFQVSSIVAHHFTVSKGDPNRGNPPSFGASA